MIEQTILSGLINNEEYARKTLPFVKPEYFHDKNEQVLYKSVVEYINKYNGLPAKEALTISIGERTDLNQQQFSEVTKLINSLHYDDKTDLNWLVDKTEKFCQDKAVYNAVRESILILDNEHKTLDKGSIPELLSTALGVSFDTHIGHDFIENSEDRYTFYHTKEDKIPFDIDLLNDITKGGVSKKALIVALAGCVHPDTEVTIRYKKNTPMSEWIEKTTKISEIDTLLKKGYDVQVDSPDGWVDVNFFIDKGNWGEYVLTTEDYEEVRCNCDHLFETPTSGWVSAKQIYNSGESITVITKNGLKKARVDKTGNNIPIVDINVNHPNHRYYTGSISSHNTGVGKSLFMCHCAASNLMAGMNVLYITLEMAEERIAERIDANLLDLTLDELRDIPKDVYVKRIDRVKGKTNGKLIIKEYPTASAGSAHFRHLLNELKLKRNFMPDVIYIDYLNICMSSRLRNASNVNSYTYIKAIAEELRGLAVEFNVPVISATQTTRSGYGNSDMDLTDTSESFGLPATADFMFGLISTEELEQLGQIMIKQLKNRWGDINYHKRFVVGIDRSKMRLFNVENAAQDLMNDKPIMDNQRYDDVPQYDYDPKTAEVIDVKPKKKPDFGGFT